MPRFGRSTGRRCGLPMTRTRGRVDCLLDFTPSSQIATVTDESYWVRKEGEQVGKPKHWSGVVTCQLLRRPHLECDKLSSSLRGDRSHTLSHKHTRAASLHTGDSCSHAANRTCMTMRSGNKREFDLLLLLPHSVRFVDS